MLTNSSNDDAGVFSNIFRRVINSEDGAFDRKRGGTETRHKKVAVPGWSVRFLRKRKKDKIKFSLG